MRISVFALSALLLPAVPLFAQPPADSLSAPVPVGSAAASALPPAPPEGTKLVLEVEPSELSIGDLFRVTLTVETPAGWLAEMPHGVAQLGDFEVRRFQPEEPERFRGPAGKMQRTRWKGELALFGSGLATLPSLVVAVADTATGRIWRLATDPVLVNVVSRGLDSTADIEPDDGPVETSGGIPLAAGIALGILALAGIVAAAWRLRAKRREAAMPPHERCLLEIERLLARGDGSSDDQARQNAFCTALGLSLRGYLDRRFGLSTLEKTTSEFIAELESRGGETASLVPGIREFCRRTDVVKFGGARLADGEALLLADQVRDAVLKTKPADEEAKR
ncbi:MAG: hypothetical protein J6Y56_00470 [Fibrobacterales bacterium]|nr:hypothetical protein [Fibrobacterales bacterium]